MNTYQRKVTANSNMNTCGAWRLEDYTFFFWDGAPGIKLLPSPWIYCSCNCSTLWDLWCKRLFLGIFCINSFLWSKALGASSQHISSSNKNDIFPHGFTNSWSHNPQKALILTLGAAPFDPGVTSCLDGGFRIALGRLDVHDLSCGGLHRFLKREAKGRLWSIGGYINILFWWFRNPSNLRER